MGTRSTIAILNKDETVKSIYAHWDGYPSGNGVTLYNHYKDIDKVRQLIDLGSLSCLKEEIIPPIGVIHSTEKPYPGVTSFHGRDGNSYDMPASTFPSLEDYFNNGELQEYDYVFKEKTKKWYLLNPKNGKLKKLENVIMNDPTTENSFKEMVKSVKLSGKLEKDLPEKNNKQIKKTKV